MQDSPSDGCGTTTPCGQKRLWPNVQKFLHDPARLRLRPNYRSSLVAAVRQSDALSAGIVSGADVRRSDASMLQ